MSIQPSDDSEQIEELLLRFENLTPKLHADARFHIGVAKTEEGVLFPIVFLPEDETDGQSLPAKFVYVLKKGDDSFHIKMQGMVILVGVGVPAEHLPYLVNSQQLDDEIAGIWERWFALQGAYVAQVSAHLPDNSALPL